jgi:hypothetical protein
MLNVLLLMFRISVVDNFAAEKKYIQFDFKVYVSAKIVYSLKF